MNHVFTPRPSLPRPYPVPSPPTAHRSHETPPVAFFTEEETEPGVVPGPESLRPLHGKEGAPFNDGALARFY